MSKCLRIATRSSRLALWQAEHVRALLLSSHDDLIVDLIPITTTGDRIIDRPLAKIGGKGLFIKELEQALFEDRADIAVHSMKDVPVEMPDGLDIPVILDREDPRDALVTHHTRAFDELPPNAVIGTSSLRRKSQLLALRSDLDVRDLRGNVTTRLERLAAGDFDAIVLAAAGLKRLGFGTRIASFFSTQEMLPAVGQGAIGVECRNDDTTTLRLIGALNDPDCALRVAAERAMSTRLNGGCDIPLAAHAELQGSELHLAGLVASLDGRRIVRSTCRGPAHDGRALGTALGTTLIDQGAGEILAELAST